MRDRVERAAAGEQRAAVGPGVGLLGGALGLRGRVGQREHDRARVEARHGLDHLAGEGAADRRDADDRGGLQRLDRGEEIGRRRVRVRVRALVLGELGAARDHQALANRTASSACAPRLRRRPCAVIADTIRSAMPMAASPAPRNSSVCSASLPPVMRSADRTPASVDRGGALDVVVEACRSGRGTSSAAGRRSGWRNPRTGPARRGRPSASR